MVNGYKVVDFGGVQLTANATKIEGIYSQISAAVDKPILASGINIAGVATPKAVFGLVQMNGTDYQITVAVTNTGDIKQLIIKNTDMVNVNTITPPSAS